MATLTLLETVNDYILTYTDVTQDKLFRGYQNRATLPQTDDYTMYWMDNTVRHGTNVDIYGNTEVSINALQERTVSIDFCGNDHEKVENRAKRLAVLGRSFISCDYFKAQGFNYNYADDMQYLPFTDENDQWVHRYRITIHLTEWDNVTLTQQTAKEVTVQKVVNVDVAYPPQ